MVFMLARDVRFSLFNQIFEIVRHVGMIQLVSWNVFGLPVVQSPREVLDAGSANITGSSNFKLVEHLCMPLRRQIVHRVKNHGDEAK